MLSSMRRCLLCPDILKNICVQAYEGGYDPECRAAVAALNATCRAFTRIATKVLWSRIFSLRPLVKCMPPDVWVEELSDATDSRSAIAITRPPDLGDWERFVANAEHVTSFRRFGLAPELDDDAYCTLCLYRPGPPPFLPNLQELVWEEPDADVFEYGYHLLGPKLKTLHIGQPPSDSLLSPFLRSLHLKCPQLRHLSVQCRSAVGPVDPIASRAIAQLQHLETIDLALPLYDDALLHLATLPTLTVAKLFIPRNTELRERLLEVNTPVFPSLTVLHISVIRYEPFITSLINLVSSTQMFEVQLCAAHDPPGATVREFLHALTRSPSGDALSSVHLSFPLPSSIPLMRSLNALPPLDHPECTLDLTVLSPLFSCPELTELEITSFFLRPDDEFVRMLATACPRLQSLRLVPPYNAGRLSEVTLDGLLPLFRLCPDLTDLALPLNATLSVPNVAGGLHDSQLVSLDVGDSPIRFPDEVAAYLSAHCTNPSLEIVAARALEGDNSAEHIRSRELHSVMWDQVGRLVKLFARVRSSEREHWMSHSGAHSPRDNT